ncbi:MAG: hypothetical protein NTW51_14580 [Cyanobacteria bacterium]|nr:hypothetical protein [Cyanobacteriota bacterium]
MIRVTELLSGGPQRGCAPAPRVLFEELLLVLERLARVDQQISSLRQSTSNSLSQRWIG